MPGLSGRMSTVIKAKISKLLDRAEDPAETLEYSYQKQIELLQNVKKGIADVVTSKKRLQLQEQKLRDQVVKLDTQARQALAAGNEELARTALERKNVAQTELQSLDSQIAQLEQQQEQMTASEQKLRAKIEQFRSRKEVIKAQYSAAEAQVRISEAATGVGEEMADVGLAMQRALDKTENMKARADAVQELEAAGTFEDLTAARRRRGRHRPPAQAAVELERGRFRAGQDEGRARNGFSVERRRAERRVCSRGRAGRSRAAHQYGGKFDREPGVVIVRISTEGQYELAESDAEVLNELDNQAVAACDSGDEEQFKHGVQRADRVRASQRAAGRRRRARAIRRDHPAARRLLRRGPGGVQRRGPDPGLAGLTSAPPPPRRRWVAQAVAQTTSSSGRAGSRTAPA